MVSSPHPVPCIDSSFNKDRVSRGNIGSEGQGFRVPGSYVKAIACGGRHSAVITGDLITYFSFNCCLDLIYILTCNFSFNFRMRFKESLIAV